MTAKIVKLRSVSSLTLVCTKIIQRLQSQYVIVLTLLKIIFFLSKTHDFLDCLRKDLRRYANEEPSYPNCTTPWHQSFLGDTEIDSKPKYIFCNQTQKEKLNNLDIEFTKKAAAYQNDNCPSMSETNCIFLHTYGIN